MVFMRQYNGGGAGRKVRALSEVSVEFGLHHKAVWCWLNSWCPRWKIGLKRVPDSKGCCRQWMRSVQFSSVAQLCLTLCEPMDCSMPGLAVHHQLPEFTQTHVHWVSDAIQPSHPLSSPCPPAFNLSQHQGLFKWVSSLHQVVKALEFQLQLQSFQWLFRTDFV